jgi:ribonuclease HI
MEIQGVIAGLSVAIEMGLHEGDIEVVSDSQYTLGIGNGSYSPTKNLEEAARLRALVRQAGAATRWVRGHAGERWNEVCDELAKQGKIEHTPASVLAKQARKKRKGKSASTETGFDKYLAGRLADPVFAAEYQAAYRELAQQEVAAAATPTPDTAD